MRRGVRVMLEVELLKPSNVRRAADIFHRDGFVVIEDALTTKQFTFAKSGTDRETKRHMAKFKQKRGNRGHARYSFDQRMIHLPEWSQLIELPTILPILSQIWGSDDYICIGAGGDYSAPGAAIQHLHSDLSEFFNDPLGGATSRDVPAPCIAVNFLMVDFTQRNGAIRLVPCTQRSRHRIPKPSAEPKWMKQSILCAPASTVVIRDVRCWHGGTANRSNEIRSMLDVVYLAPWFRWPKFEKRLPKRIYTKISRRAQTLCRFIVD